jgi:NADP-dependent 3-hydroxy acid dehydrogenase YdfG
MYQPLNLEGKVAVVVGGTAGLGRAMAVALAAAGADVVPCSRRLDASEPVALEIEQLGRRALRLAVDVANRE